MKIKKSHGLFAGVLLAISLLLLLLAFRFVHSLIYTDSDFFSFWLAGRMNWTHQNPYSETEWLAGHAEAGAQWVSDSTFPYPLPLATLLAPLGLLPLDQAYALWIYLSIVAVVVSILMLMSFWESPKLKHYLLPILAGAFLFRPFLISLRNGQLSAFLLLSLTLTAYLWEKEKWVQGGLLLALCFLKPTLGVPLIALLGLWLLARRKFTGLLGIALSATALLLLGWLRDPNWITTFLELGHRKLVETFGYSPTVWGIGGTVCQRDLTCSIIVGSSLCAALISLGALFLLQRRRQLNPTMAMSLVIPIALLVTPYIWAYDQILLILPITVSTLILMTRGYPFLLSALTFMLVSILAWILLAWALMVGHDAWSALVPAVSLALVAWGLAPCFSTVPKPYPV